MLLLEHRLCGTLHLRGTRSHHQRTPPRRLIWREGLRVFFVNSQGIVTPGLVLTSNPKQSVNPHWKEYENASSIQI